MTLHYQGGKTAQVEVVKDGRRWMYIKPMDSFVPGKYRVDKQTGEVQIAPYWNTGDGMYVD